MLLVNAYADSNGKVINTGKAEEVGEAAQHVEIVSAAESFVGAQTKIHSNADYHTVNGTDYPDAVKFFRNDAGTNRTENFNWWMDQYDNLQLCRVEGYDLDPGHSRLCPGNPGLHGWHRGYRDRKYD